MSHGVTGVFPILRARVLILHAALDDVGLSAGRIPGASGRVTSPVLYDTVTGKVISNESSVMLRIFSDKLRHLCDSGAPDLRPAKIPAQEIDLCNELVYTLNNGVYRVGFSTVPADELKCKQMVFDALDALNVRLSDGRKYLHGDAFTESDIWLYCTLVRFDFGYYYMFRCDLTQIRTGYRFLWQYLQRVHAIPEIKRESFPANYTLMYATICRWGGLRMPGNFLRLVTFVTFAMLGAHRPDSAEWRWQLAKVVTAPTRLLMYLFA
eukprot:m.661114 g.661114  ORF g.661114 m.661114 type:complete len:266 (-) comp22734_c1_seq3:274-1071(-)